MTVKSILCLPCTFKVIICVSTHQKEPVVSEDQSGLFCHFLNDCSFNSILVQNFLKSNIVFLRYGNFIEDVLTDWWKVDFEKKALKIWESVQSIGIFALERSIFTWTHSFCTKSLYLLSIEDSKICEITKSTLGLYF